MDFHSPVDAYGAWEPDEEYEGCEWWLGLTEDGNWEIISYDYN